METIEEGMKLDRGAKNCEPCHRLLTDLVVIANLIRLNPSLLEALRLRASAPATLHWSGNDRRDVPVLDFLERHVIGE